MIEVWLILFFEDEEVIFFGFGINEWEFFDDFNYLVYFISEIVFE